MAAATVVCRLSVCLLCSAAPHPPPSPPLAPARSGAQPCKNPIRELSIVNIYLSSVCLNELVFAFIWSTSMRAELPQHVYITDKCTHVPASKCTHVLTSRCNHVLASRCTHVPASRSQPRKQQACGTLMPLHLWDTHAPIPVGHSCPYTCRTYGYGPEGTFICILSQLCTVSGVWYLMCTMYDARYLVYGIRWLQLPCWRWCWHWSAGPWLSQIRWMRVSCCIGWDRSGCTGQCGLQGGTARQMVTGSLGRQEVAGQAGGQGVMGKAGGHSRQGQGGRGASFPFLLVFVLGV